MKLFKIVDAKGVVRFWSDPFEEKEAKALIQQSYDNWGISHPQDYPMTLVPVEESE